MMKQHSYLKFGCTLVLSGMLFGCSGGGDDNNNPNGGNSGGEDNTPPQVNSINPADGATNIPPNANLQATFSEALDSNTINASSFTLSDGSGNVSGVIDVNGATVTFDPDADLSFSTEYTATVTTAIKDLAGNALTAQYSWSFTTGAEPDTTAPIVSSVVPDLNTTLVASDDIVVTATFSEPMDANTFSSSTFTLSANGAPVSGVVTYDGATNTATFDPAAALVSGTTYTATITAGVADLAGNTLVGDYSWTFETVALRNETVSLDFNSDLPYSGTVGNQLSYYSVTGLTPGIVYNVTLTDIPQNRNMDLWAGYCYSGNDTFAPEYCFVRADVNGALTDIRVHEKTSSGGTFTLNVEPIPVPTELTLASFPFTGNIIDIESQLFVVTGLVGNVVYEVTLTGLSDDVDLLVYHDEFVDFKEDSQNRNSSDESLTVNSDEAGRLYIEVSGLFTMNGSPFTLDVRRQTR